MHLLVILNSLTKEDKEKHCKMAKAGARRRRAFSKGNPASGLLGLLNQLLAGLLLNNRWL
jgi:hypothetical protein